MALLEDCIDSFESRACRVREKLKPLETGEYCVGHQAKCDADWVCVTREEISRLRHELREIQTIINGLKERYSRPDVVAAE